jgi:hypothetical protein
MINKLYPPIRFDLFFLLPVGSRAKAAAVRSCPAFSFHHVCDIGITDNGVHQKQSYAFRISTRGEASKMYGGNPSAASILRVPSSDAKPNRREIQVFLLLETTNQKIREWQCNKCHLASELDGIY